MKRPSIVGYPEVLQMGTKRDRVALTNTLSCRTRRKLTLSGLQRHNRDRLGPSLSLGQMIELAKLGEFDLMDIDRDEQRL